MKFLIKDFLQDLRRLDPTALWDAAFIFSLTFSGFVCAFCSIMAIRCLLETP